MASRHENGILTPLSPSPTWPTGFPGLVNNYWILVLAWPFRPYRSHIILFMIVGATFFENETVNDGTGLVGHSAGAEFILRYLSDNSETEVERDVLVAPYSDYLGKYGDFSKYRLDPKLPERIGRFSVISSIDDDEPILRRTKDIVELYPSVNLIELNGYGHFRIGHNMTGPEFPQLLDELFK